MPRYRTREGIGIIPARAGFTAPPSAPAPESADHPRSRGVYRVPTHSSPSRPGSSPLARGLPRALPLGRSDGRIIPARAGFTAVRSGPGARSRDHPRSRGVYRGERSEPAQAAGSSPLARGLRAPVTARCGSSRIIPARAGFTSRRRRRLPGREDHPRSRGVYARDEGERSEPALARIIPARAGFTRWRRSCRRRPRDHPRSRGVYAALAAIETDLCGSSPLARGLPTVAATSISAPGIIPARAGFTATVVIRIATAAGSSPLARGLPTGVTVIDIRDGIIPARAGFTRSGAGVRENRGDHPRSRGVYAASGGPRGDGDGSSPLARGLRARKRQEWLRSGIIPARAGFTCAGTARGVQWEDHPRSRGVYSRVLPDVKSRGGSSPLARGLPAGGAAHHDDRGIIPARAGFTGRRPHSW